MGARMRSLTINTVRRGHRAGDNGELTKEDGQPLSPAGRMFHQPHFNCYIIVILGSGKTIDVDAIKAGLELTLVRHPRFSSILVSDKPGNKNSRWVRTKVVLNDHIVIPTLSIPLQSTTAADQLLEDYVSSLSITALPISRPLWDLHLINMRTSKSEATGILRMHHSLGDGISLMSLLLACTRKVSDPSSVPTLPTAKPQKGGYFWKRRGGRLWRAAVWIWVVVMHVRNTLVGMIVFVATSLWLRDSETALKGVEGVEFRRKRFVHRTLSLDDLKVIKNALGCTINDVLLGMTSAGLSRYLNRRYGDITRGKKKEINLPSNIRLRTTLIVNIRPVAGIPEMAEMMKADSSTTWGNWLGYVIVPIPLMICDDTVDYVLKGIKIAEKKRKSFEAILTYIIGCLSIKILGIKVAAALCHRLLRNTTVLLSNVVGACDEVGFCGHSLVYLAASVYGHPQAVTFHFQSYMNKMEMMLAVDELTVPDPHRLIEDFAESLKLIKDAIVARSS